MKKTTIITTLVLATLLIAGCASRENQIDKISADSAKNIALEAAGVSAAEAAFLTAELNDRDGQSYYDVDFVVNGQQYDYDVDALTGAVIADEVPVNDAAAAEETPAVTAEQPTDNNQNNEFIGEERAKELAMAHAGVTADQVTFIKSGLDRDDGRRYYDVEFYGQDYTEYDYDIDAYTGEILSFDHDAEYYEKPSNNTGANESATSLTDADAKAIALAQVPGAAESDIREFEVDYDDGRLVYEGKIYYDKMEYEFEIDGYSGAIRNWEVESIYD